MDLLRILYHGHPELMQRCEICEGNGQYLVNYPNYQDPTPDVEGCDTCNGIGYIIKEKRYEG